MCRQGSLGRRRGEGGEGAWSRPLCLNLPFACTCMQIEACDHSLNPKGHVSVILDLQDMGMMHMDLPAVKALFQLLGEHYVERCGGLCEQRVDSDSRTNFQHLSWHFMDC